MTTELDGERTRVHGLPSCATGGQGVTFTPQERREVPTGKDKPGEDSAALGAVDDHTVICRDPLEPSSTLIETIYRVI